VLKRSLNIVPFRSTRDLDFAASSGDYDEIPRASG
jgi:hypothetical protein